MEKKQKIFVGILIGTFVILLFISFFVGNPESTTTNNLSENPNVIMNNAQNESAAVKKEEKKELTEINMDTYLEYYAGSEGKIVLIGYPSCPYCQIAQPIIQNLAYEYDLEINYLNTDNFTAEDEANLSKSDEFFDEGFGTPLLLVVKDDKIVNKVDGLTDKGHYKKFFKEEGFIEEK